MRGLALIVLASVAAAPPVGDRLRRGLRPPADIRVVTEHAPVQVDGERYRLVTPLAPLVAAIDRERNKRARLVVYVVRLGTAHEPVEGATPLMVTVENQRHIFPNRPALVRERVIQTSGRVVEIASYPVRYPLGLVRDPAATVRVALRRPERGGRVGIRLAVEAVEGGAAPRNRLAKRKRRRKEPPPPPEPAKVEDAGVLASAAEADRLTDDLLDADADADAGPADAGQPAKPPEPPEPPPPPTGRVRISLDNRMPEVFRLQEIEVAVDGVPVDLPRVSARRRKAELFDGDLAVGEHELDVSLSFRGEGGFLFTYMDNYLFHAGDRLRLPVQKDGVVRVRVEAYEGGNFITEMVDRPAVRFHLERVGP